MPISFQDVEDTSSAKKKKIVKPEEKDDKKHGYKQAKTYTHHIGFQNTQLYSSFSKTVSVTSLIILASAVLTWMVMFWFGYKHPTDGFLNILLITVQAFAGCGLILAALQLFNNVLICIEGTVGVEQVFHWGLLVFAALFPILIFVLPMNGGTLTLSINRCLQYMSFVIAGMVPVVASHYFWIEENSIAAAQSCIEDSSRLGLFFLYGLFAVVGLFQAIFGFWLSNGNPEQVKIINSIIWSLSEFILIMVVLIIWEVVFLMIEDVEFSVGYALGLLGLLLAPVIACILVMTLPAAKLVQLRVLIALFSLIALPAGIGLIVWTNDKY